MKNAHSVPSRCFCGACSKALDFDPYNVKALYRRADAYQKLGTTADLELCVMDLQEAQSLEPGNHQVQHSALSGLPGMVEQVGCLAQL